jgi:hypothetical protein
VTSIRHIDDMADARAVLGGEAVRAARHAMWRAGDLRYLLHAGQQRALASMLDSEARRFVVCTGRRWGKSRLMCVLAALVCALRIRWRAGLEPPEWVGERMRRVVMRTTRPARVVYAAPTAGMVAEFVEPHMLYLAAHAPEEMRPEQDSFAGRWVFPGGDTIVMRGCEDRKKADRLRGSEADAGIADEGGFIPILDYVVRSVIGPQLWETRGPLVLPSTPPESPDHAFVSFLREAEAVGASYRARTADAPHITPAMLAEAIEDAGGADTVAWRREGEAEIIVDPERTVLPELSEREGEVVGEHPRPEHYLPHIVGDLGYEDWTVLAFGYYDFAADVDVIEAEIAAHRTRSDLIDEQAEAMARELWGEVPVYRRRIDAPPIVRADMSRRHVRDEDEADAWQRTRTDDLRAAANAMRIRLSRGRVRIHPRCSTIIAHAKYATWNRARSGLERPADATHHYDGAAALLYFGRELDRATNPVPARDPVIIDRYREHRRPREQQAEALRSLFGRRGRR